MNFALRPILAFLCQMNQISDSSRPNNYDIYFSLTGAEILKGFAAKRENKCTSHSDLSFSQCFRGTNVMYDVCAVGVPAQW